VTSTSETISKPPKPPKLGRSPTAGQLVRRAIGVANQRILVHEPEVRASDDPEAVHQMRVALRRLRSDLRTFADVLDPAWRAQVTALSRPVARALGGRRDLDVLAERLRVLIPRLHDADRAGAEQVLDILHARRILAFEAISGALGDPGYGELLRLIGDTELAVPPGEGDGRLADQPAAAVAARAVERAFRRLRRDIRALPESPPDQALHDVRIQAKRLRYAAEAAAPVLGRPASRFAADVTHLQTVLGDHQDAVTAVGWLRALASEDAERVSLAWSAGVLAGLELDAANEARARYPRAWKRVRSRGEQHWLGAVRS
jgi:CHAD domain-containing protein